MYVSYYQTEDNIQYGMCACNDGYFGDTCIDKCPRDRVRNQVCSGNGHCNKTNGSCMCSVDVFMFVLIIMIIIILIIAILNKDNSFYL